MNKKFHLQQWLLRRAISSIDEAIEAEHELLDVLLETKNDLIEIYDKNRSK